VRKGSADRKRKEEMGESGIDLFIGNEAGASWRTPAYNPLKYSVYCATVGFRTAAAANPYTRMLDRRHERVTPCWPVY
jgi:hypothetical protein